jgi:ADP-ribose pyrophosphatase YjhB (NUDIX family)
VIKAQFCQKCGDKLLYESIEGRERGRCIACKGIHYEQLIVGAGALIEQGDRLLLLKRTIDPYLGFWNLPAGHVEADEDPRDAVARETLEESGLVVCATTLFNVFFFDSHPRGCGILLAYKCSILGGSLENAEVDSEPSFFDPEDLPKPICRMGQDLAILAWQEEKSNTKRV